MSNLPPNYVLLRAIPGAQAGDVFIYNDYRGGWFKDGRFENPRYTEKEVKDPYWFRAESQYDVDDKEVWATSRDIIRFIDSLLQREIGTDVIYKLQQFKNVRVLDKKLWSSPAHSSAKQVEIEKLSFAQSLLDQFYQVTNRLEMGWPELKRQYHIIKNRIDIGLKEIKNEVEC